MPRIGIQSRRTHLGMPLAAVRMIRVVVCVGAILLMVGGPFANQVLGYKTPWLRPWVMYRGVSLELCVPTYQASRDGVVWIIDRYDALGHANKWEAPKAVRRLPTAEAVREQGWLICDTLDEGVALAVSAFCATREGWQDKLTGDSDHCQEPRSKRSKKKAR